MRLSILLRVVLGVGLLAGFGMALAVPATALTIPGSSPPATFAPLGPLPSAPAMCSGTDAAPGQLTGTYPTGVIIWGDCWINAGVAQVDGNLTIAPGATLNGDFALNDQNHGVGTSALYVTGNIYIEGNGTLILGCEPGHNTCADSTSLNTLDVVSGSVLSSDPLGVVIHHSIIGGNFTELGGGGGLSCAPPAGGGFAFLQSPVYSDLEDNWINGDVTLAGLRTCWNGFLRNYIGGDVANLDNAYADPDANEVLANDIEGDVACAGNSPVVQYGDSGSSPNKVLGSASGECSFFSYQPNPAPSGPLMPISVPG
jgi:hypothetical protein